MVSGAERLAILAQALEEAKLRCLVLGGHAVRYYGVDRNTIDYDFHVSLPAWGDLASRLRAFTSIDLSNLVEGPSWRPNVFRRFQIGRLPDGREEWLEFWRANHLLAPFDDLWGRREIGGYGGKEVAFLGLSDLIRSKETERAGDWQDVSLLEEIRDARNLGKANDLAGMVHVLTELRSRVGFEQLLRKSAALDATLAASAFGMATSAITRALLLPFTRAAEVTVGDPGFIGEILAGPMRQCLPASPRHLALVEAVRRLYKKQAMDADRADKEKALKEQDQTP